MSVFDLIIFAILIAFALRGWMTGMIAQIVSVGSLIVSWIVASRFAFLVAPSIPAEEPWNKIGAMIVLFAVTLIAVRFAHSCLEKKIKDWHLAKLNWYLGGLLGFVKGLFLCLILTFFGVMLSEVTRDIVFQSKSGNHLIRLIETTGAFIPSDSYELLHRQFALFNAQVNGTETEVSDNTSPEEKSLQKMLASIPTGQETVEKNFGNLISQGQSLLEKAQSLKQGTDQAASLLDAIGRWWAGSDKEDKTSNATESNISTSENISEKTVQPLSAPIIASPEPAIRSQNTLMESSKNTPMESSKSFLPEDYKDKTLMTPSPIRSENILFRERISETSQPVTEQFARLPLESPNFNSPDFSPDLTATQMSISRSSALFRLSRNFSMNSSEGLLHSSPTRIPATLFVPKH